MSLDWEVAQLILAQRVLGYIFPVYGDGALNKRVDEHCIRSASDDLECQRCGCFGTILLHHWRDREGYDYIYEQSGDPIPEERAVPFWVCWRCDYELMNGGSRDEEPYEIEERREQEDYEDDPINNDPPRWMR